MGRHTDTTRPVDAPTRSPHPDVTGLHTAQAPTWTPTGYYGRDGYWQDAWSGDPDTDRYWSKEN